MVIEASCNYNLFYWHHEFGHTEALNYLNIWGNSQLHKSFQDGALQKWTSTSRLIDNNSQSCVDGIYPKLSHLVKKISIPMLFPVSKFAIWQESVRKNIKYGFGVLEK